MRHVLLDLVWLNWRVCFTGGFGGWPAVNVKVKETLISRYKCRNKLKNNTALHNMATNHLRLSVFCQRSKIKKNNKMLIKQGNSVLVFLDARPDVKHHGFGEESIWIYFVKSVDKLHNLLMSIIPKTWHICINEHNTHDCNNVNISTNFICKTELMMQTKQDANKILKHALLTNK